MLEDGCQSTPQTIPGIDCRDRPEGHGILVRGQEVAVFVLEEDPAELEVSAEDWAASVSRAEVGLEETERVASSREDVDYVIEVGEPAHADGPGHRGS